MIVAWLIVVAIFALGAACYLGTTSFLDVLQEEDRE
jgi:hypothetical protein